MSFGRCLGPRGHIASQFTAQPVRMGCVFCNYICSPEVQLVYAGIGRYTGCHRPASMTRVRDDCSMVLHISLPRRS